MLSLNLNPTYVGFGRSVANVGTHVIRLRLNIYTFMQGITNTIELNAVRKQSRQLRKKRTASCVTAADLY